MTAAPPTVRTAPPAATRTMPTAGSPASDSVAMPGGARRGSGLPDHGHVHARFGGLPVLVTAEMAAQIKAFRQKQP